jgi:hypothetical protein
VSVPCARSVPSTSSYFFKINFNIFRPSTPSFYQAVSFLLVMHQNVVCVSLAPTRATCPTHLILLDLITPQILCEGYITCSFLQSPLTSCLFISRFKSDENWKMVEGDKSAYIQNVKLRFLFFFFFFFFFCRSRWLMPPDVHQPVWLIVLTLL